ncbi:ParB/RepB/Spo0J family partition protein [Escherichia coli]
MSVLLTEPTQQANDKVFKTAHVAFSVVTGTGRYVTGLKQFRDANPELCTEVSDQKAWAIHPSVIQVTPGFNSREMGMGDDYYKLPEVEEHIYNIKNAYIRGDYVDPIRVRVIDGVPFVRQGHCRLKAAMMACDEDHDITILCVEIKEDEIGCELATIDGNRGLALSPVALGESYRRLHSLAGWSLERIAQRENKSPTTISSLIRLTTCSVVIKKWIHADAISYVNVLSLIDELGETEAISRIKKMIAELEQADANGITVKKTPTWSGTSQTFRLQASTDSAGYCHKSRRRRQTHHHQLITETGGY